MTQSRILFAWELGSNFGHAVKIARVAKHLARSTKIFVAARDPTAFRAVAPDLPVTLLPAPFARTRGLHQGEAQPENYSAVLATEGWGNAHTLAPLVEAWRSLLDLVRPDVLVSQAAPTSSLAARGCEVRTAILGGGYDYPPLAEPMPLFDQERGNSSVAARQEAAVLETANGVLRRLGGPEAARFCDLLHCDLPLLVTLPHFDHYGDRAAIQPDHPPYLGHPTEMAHGAVLDWAGRPGARIFAYLRPESKATSAAFSALDALGPENDIILAAPGIDPRKAGRLRARGVQVSDGPVRLDGLLGNCDLGISHASNGIGAAFLSCGVPQIGLPGHREQAMFSRVIAKGGFGLGVEGCFGAEVVIRVIRQVLRDSRVKTRVSRAAFEIRKSISMPAEIVAADALRKLAEISR